MLSLHVKGWVVLSHAKGWVVIAHVKGWVVIAHVKGWVVLPNAKGRVVLRTTLSLTWDDNPPDLPWCIRYYYYEYNFGGQTPIAFRKNPPKTRHSILDRNKTPKEIHQQLTAEELPLLAILAMP